MWLYDVDFECGYMEKVFGIYGVNDTCTYNSRVAKIGKLPAFVEQQNY